MLPPRALAYMVELRQPPVTQAIHQALQPPGIPLIKPLVRFLRVRTILAMFRQGNLLPLISKAPKQDWQHYPLPRPLSQTLTPKRD
jgi:hypothetical protein